MATAGLVESSEVVRVAHAALLSWGREPADRADSPGRLYY